MYSAIIFGLALLFTGAYVFGWMRGTILFVMKEYNDRRNSDTLDVILFFGSIIFWSWFYYLTH